MGPPMGGAMAPYNPLPNDNSSLKSNADIERCDQIKASVVEAGFTDTVSVACGGYNAYIIANTIPEHTVLTCIVGTNEQTVAPAEGFAQFVTLQPEFSGEPLTRDSSLAVAVNGVPIYDYTS